MTHRARTVLAATLIAFAAAGSIVRTADAAATLEGSVTFTDGGGATTSGGSGVFSMALPSGASCQGSGANGYRWETLLLSSDVDVAALTFSNGPDPVSGKFVTALFDASGEQVSTKFPSNSPLGLISGIPGLSLANTVAGGGLAGIPTGFYRIGIACTYLGAVQEYWLTTLEVTADAADSPLGIQWAVSSGPTTTTTTTEVTTTTTAVTSTTVADTSTTSTSPDLVSGDDTSSSVDVLQASGPVTGSSSITMGLVAVAMLYVGRIVVLGARRVKVLPPS